MIKMKSLCMALCFTFLPIVLFAQGAGGQIKRPVKRQQTVSKVKQIPGQKRVTRSEQGAKNSSQTTSKPIGYEFVNNNFTYKIISENEVEIGIEDRSKVGTTLSIPNKVRFEGNNYIVTAIRNSSMQCLDIYNLTIPSTIRTIGSMAFWFCRNLYSIEIPAATTYIDPSAFEDCPSLRTISIDEKNPNYCVVDNVLMTKDCEFLILYPACMPGDSYRIPPTIERIAEYAFENCNLERVSIPSATVSCPASVFSDCKKLSTFIISNNNPAFIAPNNVLMTKDKKTLLRYPAGKLEVMYTIPSTINNISWGAFSNCQLERVVIDNEKTIIEKYAFRDSEKLLYVSMPQAVFAKLPEKVFSNCRNLLAIDVRMADGRTVKKSVEPYK